MGFVNFREEPDGGRSGDDCGSLYTGERSLYCIRPLIFSAVFGWYQLTLLGDKGTCAKIFNTISSYTIALPFFLWSAAQYNGTMYIVVC